MEKGIKILEEFINNDFQKDKLERNEKGGFKIGTIYKTTELNPALENLIKGYRELEEYYKEQNEVNAKFIPVSLVEETIEELNRKIKYEDNEKVIIYLHKQRKILQELLEKRKYE